jgi:hypothetical protein
MRMPRLQTSTLDNGAPHPAGRTEQMKSPMVSDPAHTVSSGEHAITSPSSAHQRFVLTDNVAFRYLEDDPSTTVLSRRERLEGYEIYLVEQWACSRIHPTFLITTYTGDPKDKVWASVLSVPKDESDWSPQMRVYFKALDEFHAHRKETSLGTLMITNLNGFPPSLTIIPVPDGDMKKHRELFYVNENLKRLGCSGRLGIKLASPSSATQAKFYQLYRTSDKIPLNSAVIELVKLCQVALVLFGKLEPEYADGLLCDVTEKAINDWWLEFGAEYYTVEPHDGILGPTTVAALLGLLMGARNRLSAYNAPVSKDVFDVDHTKRAISSFQKAQRITRTHYLDRQTLERLRRATAKAASKESWAVPRAFKSTVAELGGKGGEMVMGMVGAGEKAGIADIETVDIDRFVDLVSGEHAKWLWYGKPRKSNTGDMFSRLPQEDESNSPESHQPVHITSLIRREATLESNMSKRGSTDLGRRLEAAGTTDSFADKEKDSYSKRAAIKRATEKLESGSGFHRIKDAVGRRNHQSKLSKDEGLRSPLSHAKSDLWSPSEQSLESAVTPKNFEGSKQNHEAHTKVISPRQIADVDPSFTKALTETPRGSASTLAVDQASHPQAGATNDVNSLRPIYTDEETDYSRPPTTVPSVAGSTTNLISTLDPAHKLPQPPPNTIPPSLRRNHSVDQLAPYNDSPRNENFYARHLSFSIAEESVLRWSDIGAPPSPTMAATIAFSRQNSTYNDTRAQQLRHSLALVATHPATFLTNKLESLSELSVAAENDTVQLDSLYYPSLDTYHALREDAHELVSSQRSELNSLAKELATLGDKLEYEIGALRGKTEDLEDGVIELERAVRAIESRAAELDSVIDGDGTGWTAWAMGMIWRSVFRVGRMRG